MAINSYQGYRHTTYQYTWIEAHIYHSGSTSRYGYQGPTGTSWT